jgi:hypothetical protein
LNPDAAVEELAEVELAEVDADDVLVRLEEREFTAELELDMFISLKIYR